MITSLHLPYPPSVNHYWGQSGKQRFIGKKGKEFRQAVAEVCLDLQVSTLDTRLSVHVAIWPPDNRKRDVDNILKPLLDAMEHAGVYENDSQIDELHIIRHPPMKGAPAQWCSCRSVSATLLCVCFLPKLLNPFQNLLLQNHKLLDLGPFALGCVGWIFDLGNKSDDLIDFF